MEKTLVKTWIEEAGEKIYNLLKKNGIYAQVYSDDSHVVVLIEWGDWKHEHRYADCLIESEFPDCRIDCVVTETDSSDCYSAEHHIYGI